MRDDTILLRCGNCGVVNRLPESRLPEHPKCGKCKAVLEFSRIPRDVTSSHLSDRFQIRATPTFFLYKNGNKISDIAGAMPGPQLEAWIDASLLAT